MLVVIVADILKPSTLIAHDGDDSEEGLQRVGLREGVRGERKKRKKGRREDEREVLIHTFTEERELRHSVILEYKPDDSLPAEDKSNVVFFFFSPFSLFLVFSLSYFSCFHFFPCVFC
jgi:hypothetical protein